MHKATIAAIVAGTLGACSAAPAPTPNEQLATRAEASVRDTLMDPTTAKFKDVSASAKGNCIMGEILAKNAFGAFTGYHSFVWINGNTFIDPDPKSNPLGSEATANEFLAYHTALSQCFAARRTEDVTKLPTTVPDV